MTPASAGAITMPCRRHKCAMPLATGKRRLVTPGRPSCTIPSSGAGCIGFRCRRCFSGAPPTASSARSMAAPTAPPFPVRALNRSSAPGIFRISSGQMNLRKNSSPSSTANDRGRHMRARPAHPSKRNLCVSAMDCRVKPGNDAGEDEPPMRVYQFTEQPYPNAWTDHGGSLRVNLPNRKCDPKIAADLLHRYYDEGILADELGFDIMLNEHHQTATCMSSTVIVGLSVLARQTSRARLLVLGYPIGHRPDPLRVAEELSTIDVISRGRLDMGFIKGVPYEFAASNQNPVGVMDRFWEAHDFIIKAMSSHDGPF